MNHSISIIAFFVVANAVAQGSLGKNKDSLLVESDNSQSAFFQKYFENFVQDSLKSEKGLGLAYFPKDIASNTKEIVPKRLDHNMPIFKPEGEYNMPIKSPKGHYTIPIYGMGSIKTDGYSVDNPLENEKTIQKKKGL